MGIIAWKDMQVGQTVRFVRYLDVGNGVYHDHWGYVPGELYTVIVDDDGDVGPACGPVDSDDYHTAGEDYGFEFELVD